MLLFSLNRLSFIEKLLLLVIINSFLKETKIYFFKKKPYFISVVPVRKTSFEEEMDLFKPLKSSSEFKTEEWHEDILDKPKFSLVKSDNNDCLSIEEEEEGKKLRIDFSVMKRIEDSKKSTAEFDSSDLDSFLKSLSRQKFKEKRQKLLSEEHSDQVSVSSATSSENEDELDIKEGECGVPYYTSSLILLIIFVISTKYIHNKTNKIVSNY